MVISFHSALLSSSSCDKQRITPCDVIVEEVELFINRNLNVMKMSSVTSGETASQPDYRWLADTKIQGHHSHMNISQRLHFQELTRQLRMEDIVPILNQFRSAIRIQDDGPHIITRMQEIIHQFIDEQQRIQLLKHRPKSLGQHVLLRRFSNRISPLWDWNSIRQEEQHNRIPHSIFTLSSNSLK